MNDIGTPMVSAARGEAPGLGRLKGRRVLVVGGGQASHGGEDEPIGNGRAISVLLAREGAEVMVADQSADSAGETVDIIESEGGTGCTVVGDAASEADAIRMVGAAIDELGGLDGLVMNVGIERGHLLGGTSADEWDQAFAVNVRAHFFGCKHALPRMSDGGSIVLISSTGAFSSSIEVPSYSASKSALTGLGFHVAREGAPRRIRCNLVAPGPQDTALGRSGGRRRASRSAIPVPIGRYGTAWDAAYAVNFLLSDESTFMTGQTLVVDGGRMLR